MWWDTNYQVPKILLVIASFSQKDMLLPFCMQVRLIRLCANSHGILLLGLSCSICIQSTLWHLISVKTNFEIRKT
jgi:hypothetical protein